ncbi:MAG: glycosyltransferase family 2 protein [Acidobacteriaceae bacterium]|nr:glycosyltransferase family 2 protein [Acidobacteriaceae bacterium]
MHQVSASIVAFRNVPSELTAAISSVLSPPSLATCTVVDNSSDPSLKDCVVAAGANYVFAGKNLGFGRGHNLTLRTQLKRSPYQLVLNPDICFGPEVLPTLTAFMDANPSVGLVMPQIVYPDGSEQRLCKLLPTPSDLIVRRFLGRLGGTLFRKRLHDYEMRSFDMSVIREVPSLSGCFMFIRSSVLEEIGLFDPRFFMYMEDVDLCRRIGSHSKTIFFPYVFVVHGFAKGSYQNWKLLKSHAESAIKYFSKWGWTNDSSAKKLNQRITTFTPVAFQAHTFTRGGIWGQSNSPFGDTGFRNQVARDY